GGGISSGTVVTITLEDVEPPATGDTYELGFSRGAADTESATFSVDAPPTFVVTVDDFDDEVLEGDTVDVDVTVENTGDLQDTQTVELNVDDDQDGSFHLTPDDTQVTLASGDSESFTLSYTTKDGDAPGIDFEVTSDQDREEWSVTVETLDLSGTDATDIVPNVDQQQQTFEFTFDEALSSAETATITLENAPQDDSVLDHNNEGVVDDEGEGGSIDLDQSGTDVVFTYADGESIPAGTSVELRVPQIDVGSETDQSDPYDFVFGRSDNAGTRSIPVEVSRDTGQGELQNVEASDLVGTVPQTQEITFTPTTDMVGIESVGELVSIDLTDALDLYGNASVTSVSNATLDALDVRSDAAFIRVNADSGVSAGTEIAVTLEDVEPPATGDTYELGFSRGAADTESTTFAVDAPPNFAVTVDSFDDEVLEGDTVDVDVTVENTGDLEDTQSIQLNVDDNQNGTFDVAADTNWLTLAGGDSESFTLSYTTQDGDAPGIDFEVTSDQDREEHSATVNVSMADVVEVDENGGWTFDTEPGQTGVAFDIANTSTGQDVVITEVGVDEANDGGGNPTDADFVRDDEDAGGEFGILQNRQSNTGFDPVLLNLGDGKLDIQPNNTTGLDVNFTLGPGEQEPIGFNQFHEAGGNNTTLNMNGGSATVRLVFQDGSEDTYAFQGLPNQPS
ncbi:hypothetical protein BRC65_08170, partial [Halobacteriales archaeon QH_2_65_14]